MHSQAALTRRDSLNEAVPSSASPLRLFSTAIADQALLSATNFMAGLLMLRRVSDADYGFYVLITSALILVTGMQIALISCPMTVMAAKKEASERLGMSVNLLRRQYVVWLPLVPVALLVFTTFCRQSHAYGGTAGMIVTGRRIINYRARAPAADAATLH